ncbi:MAG: ABC transporter substrate-binding protein [Pseudomonadota bacterium]
MRLIILFMALWAAGAAFGQSGSAAERIVSVGGPITEIIYALGEEERLIARDTTSVFPPEANDLPDVGYMRRLSAEGVLSVAPDLIIARDTSGPPEAMDQLKAASVPVVLVRDGFSAEAVIDAIETVGEAIGVEEKADVLAAKVKTELDELAVKVASLEAKKRVLFVLSLDGGRMNAAGSKTGANGIIELAGGVNIMADQYSGYKLVDAEAIISAAPDVIVMMDGRGNHASRREEVLSLPQVKLTPAGENEAFLTVPGAALGFGPRAGQFGLDLFEALYGGES